MTVQVWKLHTHETHTASHGVTRDETWKLVRDRTFPSTDAAEEYVIAQNNRWCSAALHILDNPSDETIRRRCLEDDDWLFARRWFVGRPDAALIKAQLRQHGINVIE